MTTGGGASRWTWLGLGLAAAAAALGAVASAGWALGVPTALRFGAGWTPIQPSAALGLLLAGAGIALLVLGRPTGALSLAGAGAALGLVDLASALAGVDFGLSRLVALSTPRAGDLAARPMAPHAALAFLLLGLGVAAVWRGRRGGWAWAAASGSLAFALGALGMLGYAGGVEEAYGWGSATPLALPAALGLALAGGALVSTAWVRDHGRFDGPAWTPWVAGLTVAALAVAVGTTLHREERARLHDATADHLARLRAELRDRLENHYLHALQRMALRRRAGGAFDLQAWEQDAWSYLTDLAGLRVVVWQLPDGARRAIGNLDLAGGAAAGAHAGGSPPGRPWDGRSPRVGDVGGPRDRALVVMTVPVPRAGGHLAASYDARELLAFLTRDEDPGFYLRVAGRSGTLYERASLEPLPGWRESAGLDLFGSGWTVTVAPTPGELAREVTLLPWVVMGCGLALAGLLGAALAQTRRARRHHHRARVALERLRAREAELARSNAELERFAYVASHDLQEPLRQVASFVELLGRRYRGRLDADADDFIGYAVDGAHRLRRLIDDLLAYSRVGSRGGELVPIDLSAPLERALDDLALAREDAGAVVTHGPLPTVVGDERQLAQLFQNLVGNAIKFRRPEVTPTVHVGARRLADTWELTVADNGIGIDPEYFERIFLVFQRLHGREEYPGTGIGLALCRRIVDRHGGRLWVTSEPGRGSTFHFTLPGAREEGS